jgi:preprotein translocase subunit SecY
MKKFISTLKNIFSIEELRSRILNTLLLLLVYRIGTFIVLPGIDASLLAERNAAGTLDGLLGLINTFSGFAMTLSEETPEMPLPSTLTMAVSMCRIRPG